VELRVERLTDEREGDFFALMARDEHEGAHCWCVAWWVPDWPTYQANTPAQNRAVRDGLFARGIHRGYLGYADGAPVGWMQAGPRDETPKIARTMGVEPDAEVWAVSCFMVLEAYRGHGLGRQMFGAVLDDLRAQGVTVVEGYPRRGVGHLPDALWTGPEALYADHGFSDTGGGAGPFAVYRKQLS
jgi:GNAT superfamily N-acetyltransferase